jgi:hypothetical protein
MAYKCARRWWQKAVECAFIMPYEHPSDMNAVLVQRAAEDGTLRFTHNGGDNCSG